MAGKWEISGEYLETCSCDYLCPCILSNLAARPTHGACDFAMVFEVTRGRYEAVSLDGLRFAVLGRTPDVMGAGNWSVGLVVDDRATPPQADAITAIASGQAGGPVAALAPLITNFLGVERKPIQIERNGLRRSASIPGLLDQALEGMASATKPGEPLYIENTMHPANARLALARAVRSVLTAFGLRWEDRSGRNNGHFAPFAWAG